jgi:organic hydroperoxide reductase OsmC/OhrA
MSGHRHQFAIRNRWTGNLGTGTSSYTAYSRDHVFVSEGRPDLPGSSVPAFRGDPARYDPETLLVASLSACHMLWYLHFCAVNHIVVMEYEDQATGEMVTEPDGRGRFTVVELRPRVVISATSDESMARSLHGQAHEYCFIANSVNFPVTCRPETIRLAV